LEEGEESEKGEMGTQKMMQEFELLSRTKEVSKQIEKASWGAREECKQEGKREGAGEESRRGEQERGASKKARKGGKRGSKRGEQERGARRHEGTRTQPHPL
jgi:hypothetical protein